MLRRQEAFHRFLQVESCMICTDCNSHGLPRSFALLRFIDLLPGCPDDVLGDEAEFLLQFLQRRRRAERVEADAVTLKQDR
jgi:hypothetical protein